MVRTKALPGELTWQAWEDGVCWGHVLGFNEGEAMGAALATFDPAPYRGPETVWIPVRVHCELTGEEWSTWIAVHPQEPPCVNDKALHDWQTPPHIVGKGSSGEEPGVYKVGEGNISHEVCSRCGRQEFRNSWFQVPHSGDPGLKIWYEEPNSATLDWVASVKSFKIL